MSDEERLLGRIIRQAQEEARSIIDKAQEEAGQILDHGMEKAEGDKKAILEDAARKAWEMRKGIRTTTSMDMKLNYLSTKREVIDKAFVLAYQTLLQLPEDQYCTMLIKALGAMSQGKERVLLSLEDKQRVGSRIIDGANEILKGRNIHAGIILSDDAAKIKGGFILRRERMEINASFEAILQARKSELETEVVRILFG